MDYPVWVKIVAGLSMIACTIITALAMLHITKVEKGDSKKMLIRAILLAFGIMVGVWAGDKLIAPTLHILNEQESGLMLNMVKDLSLLIFGYYFGTNSKETHGSEQSGPGSSTTGTGS